MDSGIPYFYTPVFLAVWDLGFGIRVLARIIYLSSQFHSQLYFNILTIIMSSKAEASSETADSITEESLEIKIKEGIAAAGSECDHVKAVDVTGCGCGLKFELTIVSK